MKFIAHRGLWHDASEKNSLKAFQSALDHGFGIETDFRDLAGALVISHDLPQPGAMQADDFFDLLKTATNLEAVMAINVKADGLQKLLAQTLQPQSPFNYFCFDMSIPDGLLYHQHGLRFFTRESELEPGPCLYDKAAGVWMDQFFEDWIQPAAIQKHLEANKEVCIVSPELHKRSHQAFWERLKSAGVESWPNVMLCTDYALSARDFFLT